MPMDSHLPALAVFDLAGTTLEDDGTVAALFKAVLAAEGLPLGPEQLARVRGAAKREAFRTLAGGAARAERMFESFIRAIRQHYAARAPREVAGASATLAWLSQRGVQLALNTGFDRSTAEPLVAANGVSANLTAIARIRVQRRANKLSSCISPVIGVHPRSPSPGISLGASSGTSWEASSMEPWPGAGWTGLQNPA
jgi:phosphoglycolate phosphatase-like HAD superfamily hydrolase